jgi:hypothetical protein
LCYFIANNWAAQSAELTSTGTLGVKMKITNIEVILVDRPAANPPFVWRKNIPGSDGATVGGWLVIETDAGITGFATAARGVVLKD